MSTLLITNAGLNYKDAVFAGDEVQNITHFVFANVPGLQPDDVIDPDVVIPAEHVVATQTVEAISKLDGNAVVMSAVLGYDVGDFTFNWYGAVARLADNSEILIAVVHTAVQSKTKTVGPNAGNYSVKSVVWRSNAIAASLNVTLAALPWQLTSEEFVFKADFENHSHNASDIGAYSKAEIDNHSAVIDISENKTAVTVGNRIHVFTTFADLKIPEDAGTSFRFVVDDSVDLTAGKCRLLAPIGKLMSVTGTMSDIADIQETGVLHHALYINGVWKV